MGGNPDWNEIAFLVFAVLVMLGPAFLAVALAVFGAQP